MQFKSSSKSNNNSNYYYYHTLQNCYVHQDGGKEIYLKVK